MTEIATAETDKRKRKIVNGIILSGWVLTLLTMIAIMGAALYVMIVEGREVPETLKQWAGVALGFLFGNFTGIIKDYIA